MPVLDETETTRIQSIIEFIKHTLSRSAALQLCSRKFLPALEAPRRLVRIVN